MKNDRKSKKFLWLFGVVLLAAILVIGVSFFLKKDESGPEEAVIPEELTGGSFTDLFSDSRWIDTGASSLELNIATDRITFPARFLWEETTNDQFFKSEQGEDGGSRLEIYGTSTGRAYHTTDGERRDISEFFGFGVMRRGFSPRIIRGERAWYVWSGDKGKPVLLKLYEDTEGRIAGSYDFTERLFPEGASKIEVQKGVGGRLLVRVEKSGEDPRTFRFLDQGFSKEGTGRVVSKNINSFPALVRQARILEARAYLGRGEEIQFFLSADGEEWQKVEIGEWVKFEEGDKLFWRADMTPSKDEYSSSALQNIRLEYKLYFPEGFEAYKEKQKAENEM
ncbi:MAG: hypothetical protein AAB634_01395 [Patescibacteria group bacterium]